MTEKSIHKQICTYIKLAYPRAIFNTDLSGMRMTIGQSVQAKKLRSSNAFPDIVIYEPNSRFNGLFLEVKKETPFKKNGDLKKNEHLKEQESMLNDLFKRGYDTDFVWTFEMAKDIIDEYLTIH